MPRYPNRAATSASLSHGVFSALVRKAKSHPGPVYPLHVGDTYKAPPAAFTDALDQAARQHGIHTYSPVQGEPILLEAIATYVNDKLERAGQTRRVDVADIQVQSGATAGMSVVAAAVLDEGDEVILPSPFWPLIRGIIASRGAHPVEVPLYTRLSDPDFDLEATLEAAITPKTTAIYLNSPNNPSGQILNDAHNATIEKVAARHNLWVLCDEAYEELAFGAPVAPFWTRPGVHQRTIVTHTLSKTFAIAGARIGFTHGPHEVMETIRSVQTYATYCAPQVMQHAAAAALREGQTFLDETRAAYARAAQAAAACLNVPRPQGGTFVFFDCQPYLRESEPLISFLERCLKGGVLLTPGTASGGAFGSWARLCFTSVPLPELEQGLDALSAVLRDR